MRNTYFLALIFFLGFIVRLIIAFLFEGTGDTGAWRLAAQYGNDIYHYGEKVNAICVYCINWPPITYHYYVLLGNLHEFISRFISLPDFGFFKIPSVLADSAIIFIIYFISKALQYKNTLLISSLYAFNPVAIYIAAYHGQRDSIWVLFLLLSILMLIRKKYLFAYLMFSVGVSFKIPALLFLPLIFFLTPGYKKKLIGLSIVPFVFLLLNLPEIVTSFDNIYQLVFKYKGWYGWWGFSGIATKVERMFSLGNISLPLYELQKNIMNLTVLVVSFFVSRSKNIIFSFASVVLTIHLLIPSFATQYIIWSLPFVVLLYNSFRKITALYIFFSMIIMINFYSIAIIPIASKIFVEFPVKFLFSNIPYFEYPMDLSFPLWILTGYLGYKVLRCVESEYRQRGITILSFLRRKSRSNRSQN